ncbi:c-type cytochrome [Paenibacillus abyssi]
MKQKAAIVMTAAMLLSGCGASTDKSEPQTGTDAVETGQFAAAQKIYKQNCMTCHGADLQGQRGPNLQKIGSSLNEEQIAGYISNGRGGMPPFKTVLTDEEIHELAAWLASKK